MRDAEPGARVADEVARREVVGAVEDEVVVGEHVHRRHRVETLPVPHDDRVGRDGRHGVRGGVDLGATDVVDAVHHLPLEVGRLDDVVVDDPDGADPAAAR